MKKITRQTRGVCIHRRAVIRGGKRVEINELSEIRDGRGWNFAAPNGGFLVIHEAWKHDAVRRITRHNVVWRTRGNKFTAIASDGFVRQLPLITLKS